MSGFVRLIPLGSLVKSRCGSRWFALVVDGYAHWPWTVQLIWSASRLELPLQVEPIKLEASSSSWVLVVSVGSVSSSGVSLLVWVVFILVFVWRWRVRLRGCAMSSWKCALCVPVPQVGSRCFRYMRVPGVTCHVSLP